MKNKFFISALFLIGLALIYACSDDGSSTEPKIEEHAPVLDKIEPTSGLVGDTVRLFGRYFGSTRGSSYVTFAGNKAESSDYISWKDTIIAMKAPQEAQTGGVIVHVGDSVSNSVYFTLGEEAGDPFITRLKPNHAKVGANIEIHGVNFGNERGGSYVEFNGKRPSSSNYVSWLDTKIEITVPNNAESGPVTVTIGDKTSNEVPFTVEEAPQLDVPEISGISPDTAQVGDIVKIFGKNFRTTRSAEGMYNSWVTVGGAEVDEFNGYYQWKDTIIQIFVPPEAQSGKIQVITYDALEDDTLKSNKVDFTLGKEAPKTPIIEHLSQSSAQVGQSIDIIGRHFGESQGDSYITLAGERLGRTKISFWSNTKISIQIPQEAETGDVVVTVNDLSSNGVRLTIRQQQPKLIEMVEVQSGSFIMGKNTGDSWDLEHPAHRVNITYDFYVGKYEVTQKQWSTVFMGSDPSYIDDKGDNKPVNQVPWYEQSYPNVVEWCNAASERDGYEPCYTITDGDVSCDFSKNGYRLPTEAEWEYMARAGTTDDWSFDGDIEDYAWVRGNSDTKAHEVGQKQPNPWGIYDVYGNVAEWCWDWLESYPSSEQTDPRGPDESSGNGKLIRGGSMLSQPNESNSWYRQDLYPTRKERMAGFRVVRTKTE